MLYLTEATSLSTSEPFNNKINVLFDGGAFSSPMLGFNDADVVAIAYSNATGTAAFLLVCVQSVDYPPAHIP